MDVHKWTDAEIRRAIRAYNGIYTQAYRDCKAEMLKIRAEIDAQTDDEEKRKQMWQQKKRLDELSRQMAEIIVGVAILANDIRSKTAENIFTTVYGEQAQRIKAPKTTKEHILRLLAQQRNPFNVLSEQALQDKSVLERKLKSELLTSVLRGEGSNAMAKRVKTVVESQLKDNVRLTRTQATQLENGATQDVGESFKADGKQVWKRWVSQRDEKVREAHDEADGQEVPVDEPFTVGGELLMYPGDTSLGATAKNIINCRCYIVLFTKA